MCSSLKRQARYQVSIAQDSRFDNDDLNATLSRPILGTLSIRATGRCGIERPSNISKDTLHRNLTWQKTTLEGFRTIDSKIYLLVVPRAFSQSSGLSIASEPGAGEFPNFKSLQHWAILVGNVVYEVRRDHETGGHELRVKYFTSLEDWRAGYTVQMTCLGQTPHGPRTRENIGWLPKHVSAEHS
ncbi:uncharacterized protein PAC_17591 [Phialocephala subalpina]|uniref:Uncharacterized protein n=1 Tax=Phialocephala subalpina TaxID=576137 RepID=A0A1L7XRL2_9HELO|nr:uncharacterized protein PAC_17591 [Phialocephala subalpina]